MKLRKMLFSAVAVVLLSIGVGQSEADASENGIIGIILGGASGGYIGSHIGGGQGRLVATAAGTLIGAAIGNEMGENTYRTQRDVYTPSTYPRRQSVYRPRYERPYPPVYTPQRHARPDRVVVHKHKVIVKHVYVSAKDHRYNDNRRRNWKRERRDRDDYEHEDDD